MTIIIIMVYEYHEAFRPETVFNYVRLEDVLSNFEGYRVRFVYDNSLVKDLIVLQHIVPHFVDRLPTYIVLYSEALYYKFVKRVSCLVEAKPELSDAIDKLKIIKIGKNEEAHFGELAWFIEQGDLEEEFESLLMFLGKMEERSALILYGSIEYYLTGIGSGVFKKLVDLFSTFSEEMTIFGFRHRSGMSAPEVILISELYDIVVNVWKDNQSFDNTTFCFTIECQCRGGVKHGKLKIENGLLKSII